MVVNLIYKNNGCKCSSGKGKQFKAPPVTANVNRRRTATVKEIPRLVLEENRLMALNSVKEARVLADNSELERAKNVVDEAKNTLERVKVDDPTELIKTLIYELQQISDFMTTKDVYEQKGRSYAMSFETSHERQRYAARGDMDKVRSFATPRMNAYLEQAKKFDTDPSTPPPTEKEDLIKDPKPPIIEQPPAEPPFFITIFNQVLKFLDDLLKLITGRRT